jgi:hypothetical protein
MAGDYQALATVWATLPNDITLNKLIVLNNMTLPGEPVDVSIAQVESYLVNKNKLGPLTSYLIAPPSDAVPQAVIAGNYLLVLLSGLGGPTITTSETATQELINEFLAAMVSDPHTGFSQADVDALLAMTISQVPWWQVHGFPAPIGLTDLIAAGNLY